MRSIKERVIKNWEYADKVEINNTDFIYNHSGIKGRSYAIQNTTKYFKEAFAAFNLYPDHVEERLGIMLIKHDQDGTYTQQHRDPAPSASIHVRVNVMLKKPPKGGDAVIDGNVITLDQNDIWLIYTNLEYHGSTPIYGGERLIYSFGGILI